MPEPPRQTHESRSVALIVAHNQHEFAVLLRITSCEEEIIKDETGTLGSGTEDRGSSIFCALKLKMAAMPVGSADFSDE
jgi:hypothetical protein